MAKVILAIFLFHVNLIAGQFISNHDYLMEKFRETAKPANIASIETKWITQRIDQFNLSDQRTWKMKYLQNMEMWLQGGPIFIYIGGEGAITTCAMSGFLYELATETNGAMFATEHRFYGDSQPFETASTSNFKYLSSVQALADVANLIKQLKQTASFNSSKVVVVGGSYSGNLAAWMRLRYPDLVDAAISSSAPVLAKLDFSECLDQVGIDFEKYGMPDCMKQTTDTFKEIKDLLKSSSGIEQLKEKHKICKQSDLTKPDNQAFLFLFLTYPYMGAAQHGPVDAIKNYCSNSSTLQEDSDWCILIDFDVVFNQNNLWPRLYQMCTEFGYFTVAPSNMPFAGIPLDIDFFVKMCTSTFGPEFDKASVQAAIKKTNDMYGGLRPNVSKVIFSNGEIDPWHRLSVLEDLAETVPARIIPEGAHCIDLFLYDNAAVKKVQAEEKMFIKKWIGIST